jgi:hypothetical protein
MHLPHVMTVKQDATITLQMLPELLNQLRLSCFQHFSAASPHRADSLTS